MSLSYSFSLFLALPTQVDDHVDVLLRASRRWKGLTAVQLDVYGAVRSISGEPHVPGAVIKAGLVPVAMPSASSLDDIAPVTTALQAWHIERKGKEAKEARCAICARSGVRTIVEVLAEHGGSLDLVTACIDVLTTLGLDASLKRTATAQLPVLLGPSGLV